MYGMGETPLILQGAAQREKLNAEQLERLKMQGIQITTAAAGAAGFNLAPMLLPVGLGLLAAWFIGGGHRGMAGRTW